MSTYDCMLFTINTYKAATSQPKGQQGAGAGECQVVTNITFHSGPATWPFNQRWSDNLSEDENISFVQHHILLSANIPNQART